MERRVNLPIEVWQKIDKIRKPIGVTINDFTAMIFMDYIKKLERRNKKK
jgi:hypothetical protein